MRAGRGTHGMGSNKTGAGGDDAVIMVPPGTVVRDFKTGETLGDLVADGDELVVARGGRGGRGNVRFASATNRTPRTAEPGGKGEVKELELELKLLADVGLARHDPEAALVALARWGLSCTFAGVVADDRFGPVIRASLDDEGVARLLRGADQPVILAANKAEGTAGEAGLIDAWSHLGQRSPDGHFSDCGEFWEWAIPHWDISLVPRERNIGL